jgi:soluble lytic murein transglycosylase-like protein
VGKIMFASCVLFYSLLAGIDPIITQAVIQVESQGNPYALGKAGDSGLMQIRHQFVPETQLQLFQGCTNIRRGVDILKQAKEKCKHKINNTWVVCYNVGIKGGQKIKHPTKFPYYKKIMEKFNK